MSDTPQKEIIIKLKQSVSVLEGAISMAAATIIQKFGKDHPASVRLDSYTEVIKTQKEYINNLINAVENNNWSDVSRMTQIINGLSSMIKDDARAMVECMYEGKDCEIDKDVLN